MSAAAARRCGWQISPYRVRGELYGLTAINRRNVWAVGETGNDQPRPLALRWLGTRWKSVSVPKTHVHGLLRSLRPRPTAGPLAEATVGWPSRAGTAAAGRAYRAPIWAIAARPSRMSRPLTAPMPGPSAACRSDPRIPGCSSNTGTALAGASSRHLTSAKANWPPLPQSHGPTSGLWGTRSTTP
jgi:hypothetical protein